MALKQASDVSSSGSFFKPADHDKDLAMLVEPRRLEEGVETTDYHGKPVTEDRIIADVAIFENSEQLDKGEPAETAEVTFTHTALVNAFKRSLADPLVGVVRKKPGKTNSYWAFTDVDAATFAKVEAYYEARESAEVPDFLS